MGRLDIYLYSRYEIYQIIVFGVTRPVCGYQSKAIHVYQLLSEQALVSAKSLYHGNSNRYVAVPIGSGNPS
jgi:hypothetical protein